MRSQRSLQALVAVAITFALPAVLAADLTDQSTPYLNPLQNSDNGRVLHTENQSWWSTNSYNTSAYSYVYITASCSDRDDGGGASAYVDFGGNTVTLCHAEGTGTDDSHDRNTFTLNVKTFGSISVTTERNASVKLLFTD